MVGDLVKFGQNWKGREEPSLSTVTTFGLAPKISSKTGAIWSLHVDLEQQFGHL